MLDYLHRKGKSLWQTSVPSDEENRRQLIQDFLKLLQDNQIVISLSDFEINLIIDEAVTNGMEHGNGWDPNKELHFEVFWDKDFLNVYVRDEGNGFDKSKLEQKLKGNRDLSPRGRGIFIISSYCQVEWNRKGNEVLLQLKLKE